MTKGDVEHYNKEQARHGAALSYTMCRVIACLIRPPQGGGPLLQYRLNNSQ